MTASAIAAARAVIRRLANNAAAAAATATTTSSPPSSSAWCALDVAIVAFRAGLPRHLSVDGYYAALLPLRTAPPASTAENHPSAPSAPSSTKLTVTVTDLSTSSARATATAADLSTPPPPAPKNLCLSTARHSASSAWTAFLPTGSRPFSSVTATPTPPPPPTDLCPRVGDIINHLETEKFTTEEYSFLLRIIYAKLGQNRELADLLTQEGINLSCTNDETVKHPMLARVETKVDILTKKVTEGNAKILKCVQVSNKGEWGTIEVFGKKLYGINRLVTELLRLERHLQTFSHCKK